MIQSGNTATLATRTSCAVHQSAGITAAMRLHCRVLLARRRAAYTTVISRLRSGAKMAFGIRA
ncbi:hypothetical protein ACVIHI_001944 [Bradyrhizobium sp. USDA 4524]|nr:hypothetical protein [Bradyrhizobium sp. USDA 4538]MCP1905699.1 hypothetical protein [Bradyrhizobium sp. USDA 4537]MCP1988645.1 hypothetical protein [Bradyrhizobium sp. USDA 4539]